MVEELLKFGCDPNITTKGGMKPSQMAFPEAKKLLLQAESGKKNEEKNTSDIKAKDDVLMETVSVGSVVKHRFEAELASLGMMGFTDRAKCIQILEKFNGSVEDAIGSLL